MLQLVLGIAGTGKTAKLLELIEERATAGLPSIFLVPEQFSSSAEGLVYGRLGDAKNGFVDVLSFRTLAERILKTKGGISLPVLSDAARVMFVRRALDALGEDVRQFGRHRQNAAFCAMAASTLSELKTAGASANVLRQAAQSSGDAKMSELALLLEAYQGMLENVACDPEDRLQMAADRLTPDIFANRACFVDDFDGFTAPEYALLEQLMKCSPQITVSLCCDDLQETNDGLGLFSPVRRTGNHLHNLAQRADVQTAAPIKLGVVFRGEASGLKSVNHLLAYGQETTPPTEGSLYISPCANEWEESCLVATQMRLLAANGVPYSRMAVVCRELSSYESSVRRAFTLYDIPYFYDASGTVEYTAPITFLRSAIQLLYQGLTTAPIIALLKTGLCGFQGADIAALENYAYTWSPKAADWRTFFTRNPGGLLSRMDTASTAALQAAENVRSAVIPALDTFISSCAKQNATEISRQLYLLLQHFGADKNAETLNAQLAQKGEIGFAQMSRRSWDLGMSLLDQMVALVGEEIMPPREYDDLFLLLVRSTEFGRAPQALECAIFTSADRMRLSNADYCFIIGAVEGEFPMQVGYSGLLTHADRELLVELGVRMPGSFENRTLLEEMFFYRALTAANQALYISFPARRGGTVRHESSSLKPISINFSPPQLSPSLMQKAATPKAAFMLLARHCRAGGTTPDTLFAALQQSNTQGDLLALLQTVQPSASFSVDDKELLRGVIGQEMQLSPTRTEQYYKCAFSYYLERVLKIKPRRKAEISPLESGSFVHYVLEQTVRELGERFPKATNDELQTQSDKWAKLYIEENLPITALRQKELLRRVLHATLRLLQFLRDDAAQNMFAVDALELSVGGDDGVPAYAVHTPDGNVVRIIGQIDRVDTLQKDGSTYIRIIDYKTGNKDFKLDEVFCGLNMQMLIYMAALQTTQQTRYTNPLPAGVLYLLSDPSPKTGARGIESAPPFKYDGLLLNDNSLLRCMDKDASGIFLPLTYLKNGNPRQGKALASLEKLGRIQTHIQHMLAQMADGVYSGNFDILPLVKGDSTPCTYCPYRLVCRHQDGQNEQQISAPSSVFEEEKGEEVTP